MNAKLSCTVAVAILASLLNIIHTANGDQNIIISKVSHIFCVELREMY